MRTHIRAAIYACLFAGICLSTTLSAQAEDTPKTECSPHFTGKYDGGECKVIIDRNNPATPLPVTVPRDTNVSVVIINARPLEKLSYDESVSRIDKPDVASNFVQNVLDPLKSTVFKSNVRNSNQKIEKLYLIDNDELFTRQKVLGETLANAQKQIEYATTALDCLAKYKETDSSDTPSVCSDRTLTPGTFVDAKNKTIEHLQKSIVSPANTSPANYAVLPAVEVAALSSLINEEAKPYSTASRPLPPCPHTNSAAICPSERLDRLTSNQSQLEGQLKDLQDAQKLLLKALNTLNTMSSPDTVEIQRAQGKDSTSTIKITATEQLQQTATVLGTVTITWQNNPWLVSTGVLFSSLSNNTFSVAPAIVDGKQSVNDDGDPLSQVAESTQKPAVVLPLVMANYRVASWQKCGLQCGLYLSSGAGLNIGPNEANFAAGISFQYGGVLISPLAHIGREAHLTSGLKVGDPLGANPPSSLPTASDWKVAFGIGISYILPFK